MIWRGEKANISINFSNRTMCFKQNYLRWEGNRATCIPFSAFMFGRRTHPAWAAYAFLNRQALGGRTYLWAPQGPCWNWTEEQESPHIGKNKQKDLQTFRDNGCHSLPPFEALVLDSYLRLPWKAGSIWCDWRSFRSRWVGPLRAQLVC